MFQGFYEYSLLATTALGAAVGGWIDFKTSEIPDEVPLFIAISALLLHISNGLFGDGWQMLLYGFGVGIAYLVLGYLMYYSGQWGEADVLLLAAVGFALPQPLSFFNVFSGPIYPLLFLLNTFVVGAVYSLLYSIVKAFLTKGFLNKFREDISHHKKQILLLGFVCVFALGSVAALMQMLTMQFFISSLHFIPIIIGFYLLYRFAHTVDVFVFRAKIPTSKLREGDVLAEDIPELKLTGKLFIGLTDKQIAQIRKKRRTVLVKEGVRYAPTFFLSILFTLFFGSLLLGLLSF